MEKTPTFQIQSFGPYYLLERIAVGGMAEIFKAKHEGVRGFEKIVVIKKILHHLSEDPEFVEMFEDEARIAAQLTQANIVQIFELGEIEQTLYITMEYVDGKNLRDITRGVSFKALDSMNRFYA
jgi:serine/threonine protein kinase